MPYKLADGMGHAVAYAFGFDGLACVEEASEPSNISNFCYQLFATGDDCRNALSCAAPTVQVIVTEAPCDITPINLAAALVDDEPRRDVYLMADQPSGSLASRAAAAGIRGIISSTQAAALLGLDGWDRGDDIQGEGPLDIRPAPASLLQPSSQASTATLEKPVFKPVPTVLPAARPVSQPASADVGGSSGRVVSLVSGRGGVGKSTLALLLALRAAQQGRRAVLLDLDLQFGDVGYLAGTEPQAAISRWGLPDLLRNSLVLTPLAGELCLVEAPAQPEEAERYAAQIPPLLKMLKEQAELVIVNTGSFWTGIQAELAHGGDQLLFVMDQRATAIHACKQAVELCIRLQVPSTRFAYVLNRCARNAPLTGLDASLALDGAEVWELAEGGPMVDELLSLGCPHELLLSGSPLVGSLEALLAAVCEQMPPAPHVEEAGGRARAGRATRRGPSFLSRLGRGA